jgi:hypothetical protein
MRENTSAVFVFVAFTLAASPAGAQGVSFDVGKR